MAIRNSRISAVCVARLDDDVDVMILSSKDVVDLYSSEKTLDVSSTSMVVISVGGPLSVLLVLALDVPIL